MRVVVLLFAFAALAPSPAVAEPPSSSSRRELFDGLRAVVAADARPFALSVTKRLLDQTRRSLTLGPYLGLATGRGDGEGELQVSFGLGLQRYDIPFLPELSSLQDLFIDRAMALVKRRIESGDLRVEGLDEAGRRRVAEQVWREVKQQFLLEVRRKRLEDPGWRLALGGSHQTGADAWDIGAMAGFGFGPGMVSTGASLRWDDGLVMVVPVELSVPILLTDGLRSPVLDVFARGEFPVSGRGDRADVYSLGVRFSLDVL